MSFLNATLLASLLPLAFAPLVIHLLNKRFPRIFHFSSVRNIRETVARSSRLFRWRHWILLLVRTLALVALLLVFLRPFLDRFGAVARRAGGRQVLLVVDHSLSMEYKGEGVSCRARAQVQAAKILDTLGPDDRVNLLLAGQTATTCFTDFSPNFAEARRFIERLPVGWGRGDFQQVNAVVARLVAQSGHAAEVYYLSDFQRKNWANADFTALPPATRLFFMDVSTELKDNWAILEASINQSQVLSGDTVMLQVTVGNFSAQPFEQRLKVVLDQRVSFEHQASIPPWSVGKVVLPVAVGTPGLHLCEISLPPDGLEADNHHHLTIPVLEKEEVLIVSDDPKPEKDAVLFLKTALNPYDRLAGSLLPRHVTSRELTPVQLAAARKVFLTRLDALEPPAAQALSKFLFAGGGALWFLDGKFDAANLQTLETALGKNVLPLKLGTRRAVENVATGAQQVVKGDFKSRYLRLFKGASRQDLALLEFYDFYHASSTGAGGVLLTYADDTPAMAFCDHGLGTLLLLNFSASELSSNLARQRIFPAWIQELVRQLDTREPPAASSLVGEPVQGEVWRTDLQNNTFRSPSGQAVVVRQEPVGERIGLGFTPPEPGFYTLRGSRLLHAFAVNPSPDESDLRAVDKSLLPDQLKEGQGGTFVQGQAELQELVQGRPLFHWFVFATLAFLVLELALQLLFKRLAT